MVFGIIMNIILVIVAIVILVVVLWTIFSDMWSGQSEEMDRVENAKLDFMDTCEATSQCMLTASSDPSAHLECVKLEDRNRCLVTGIDNCTEFEADARGAEFTECISCDTGYVLLNGRCNDEFYCSSGTYEVKDGIPGCY